MVLFCKISNIADLLQIEIDEVSATRAIIEATAAIKNYCKQVIELVEDDIYNFDIRPGRREILLPELPVIEVSLVVEDGENLTEDEDYKVGGYGQLYRLNQFWAAGIQIVEVTYSHGFDDDDLPDDIVSVCTRAASRVYQAGLMSSEHNGLSGIASKSLGDFSVSYSGGQGGGVGEGIMGVSGSRFLLLSEKDILNKYRLNDGSF